MLQIGKRIANARKAGGLSLRKLAQLMDLSHAAIKKYEDGLITPSSSILLKLSKELKVTVEYFLRPVSINLEEIKFRKRDLLKRNDEKIIKAEIYDQIERRLELEFIFPHPLIKSYKSPSFLPDTIESMEAVESIAWQLREEWSLGTAPIHDFVDILEKQGIRVLIVDHSVEHFDGLSSWANKEPLIVISSNWPGDRQRFTLAHELGHLILHERLAIDEEKACNRFAGAFLFPQDAVLKEFGSHRNSIELQEFAIVKGEYRLSMASICHRLHDLEIINEHYFNSLIQQFKHHGWNKNEPGEQTPKEKSHVFKQMIFHALGEEYISESKAAELLKLPLDSFKKIRLMENHFDVGN